MRQNRGKKSFGWRRFWEVALVYPKEKRKNRRRVGKLFKNWGKEKERDEIRLKSMKRGTIWWEEEGERGGFRNAKSGRRGEKNPPLLKREKKLRGRESPFFVQ